MSSTQGQVDNPIATIELRRAQPEDIDALNSVIVSAMMQWKLPERVKRLSQQLYRYQLHDLDDLHVIVAQQNGGGVVGVAAWGEAHARELSEGQKGLMLHGIYVTPGKQHLGIGSKLFRAALVAARDAGYDGLLVKAQSDAVAFFEKQGMMRLPVLDTSRDYSNRFWLPLN